MTESEKIDVWALSNEDADFQSTRLFGVTRGEQGRMLKLGLLQSSSEIGFTGERSGV